MNVPKTRSLARCLPRSALRQHRSFTERRKHDIQSGHLSLGTSAFRSHASGRSRPLADMVGIGARTTSCQHPPMAKLTTLGIPAAALCVLLTACSQPRGSTPQSPLTVAEARSLPTARLAAKILGPFLGQRIIEVVRYDHGETGGPPEKVEFYSQPETPSPRLNRICSIDVITVEYDWMDFDRVNDTAPLQVKRVSAESRYKTFDDPLGEPGTEAYQTASDVACARMNTATDAFRAPSAGDAQWLAAVEKAYLQEPRHLARLPFSCGDFADNTCASALAQLRHLELKAATTVERTECDLPEQRWALSRCYRLTFPYADSDDPEWKLTVLAGIRTGSSPVEIRSLHLAHVEEPLVMY